MLLLLTACARLHSPAVPVESGPAPLPSLVTEPPPALDEADLAGLLANPGERLTVVNFWATWCGPCVREMGVFSEVAAEHPDVAFILVNVEGPRSRAAVERFLANEGQGIPSFTLDTEDASGLLSRVVPAWPDIIPVTLVLEPGGAVRTRFDGALDAPALRAALQP